MKLHDAHFNERRKWFAWYPVRCEDGELVWLEIVERYNRGGFQVTYFRINK